MRFRNIAPLVAASLLVASTGAAAQSQAAPEPARASAELEDSNAIGGEGLRVYVIGLIALAVVAYLVLEVIGGGGDEEPASP